MIPYQKPINGRLASPFMVYRCCGYTEIFYEETEMSDRVVLRTRDITKRFGGLLALNKVNLELHRGEILALVGDNGAGKSTLIKIIAGALVPDSGELFINDQKVQFEAPSDAKEMGIETVYQNLALVNSLDVANNLFLGKEKTISLFGNSFRILKHKEMERSAREILEGLGINIPNIRERVKVLSGGQRQCIAVARAATFGKNIVLLDEPTAALGVKEARHVLDIVGKLKEQGISIIIITHNLEHAFLVADRFFVIRLGEKVGEKLKKDTNVNEIVKMITGGVFVGDNNAHN
jgi:fructose transport system ATP-binding protein